MGPRGDTGLGMATTSSGHPGGLGGEVGVMRSLKGGAPSASLTVHPRPEFLSNRKGRRGGKLASPAQHKSCAFSDCVLLLTLGGQRIHVALAQHLSPPGDTTDPVGQESCDNRAALCPLHQAALWHPKAPQSHCSAPRKEAEALLCTHSHVPQWAGSVPIPGGPVRTRATRRQTAASHPDSSRGVSAAHLLLQHSTTYPGEPGVTP